MTKVKKTYDEINSYQKKKGKNHNNYKHYCKSKEYKKIKEYKSIFLTDGSTWNDQNDNIITSNDKNLAFAYCLSYSKSENASMWVMYTGFDKKGVMISFPKKVMLNIINNKGEIEIGTFENDKYVPINKISPDNYDIGIYDVCYFREQKNKKYTLRLSDRFENNISKDVITKLNAKHDSWHYENECRLIVSFNKKYINNYNSKKNKYIVRIPIDISMLKFTNSPNSEKDDNKSEITSFRWSYSSKNNCISWD